MNVTLNEIQQGLDRQTNDMLIEEKYKMLNAREDKLMNKEKIKVKEDKNIDAMPGYLNKRSWLLLLLLVSVPILGWIFLIHGAISKKSTMDKKNFCIAYMLMKVVFMAVSSIFMFIGYQVILKCIEYFLQYIA